LRLIIAGDRRFNDYEHLCAVMNSLYLMGLRPTEIVSGRAKGADTLGERWAREHHIPVKHHKAAGHIRNKQMADYAKEDAGHLLAFLAEGSKGTKNMIETARKLGLSVMVEEVVIPEEGPSVGHRGL
jgi:hypothetical protein